MKSLDSKSQPNKPSRSKPGTNIVCRRFMRLVLMACIGTTALRLLIHLMQQIHNNPLGYLWGDNIGRAFAVKNLSVENLAIASSSSNVGTQEKVVNKLRDSQSHRADHQQQQLQTTLNNDSTTFLKSELTAISQIGFDDELAASKSSVDYYACCGAGHRLARTSDAYHIARELHLGLRVFWGWCGSAELYSYLFGPEPIGDLQDVTSYHQAVPFRNEVTGFSPIQRTKLSDQQSNETNNEIRRSCASFAKKAEHDAQFYASLRDRFRLRDAVETFVRKNFHPASYTIGMHIRAGNNETGHFVSTGRTIHNVTSWTRQVAQHVQTLLEQRNGQDMNHNTSSNATKKRRPVLFIATDTPSMLATFRSMFNDDILQVVSMPHPLLNEGEGVMFGEHGAPTPTGDECLRGWETTLTEMMVLSHVDTLVVPRLSSFSQTLPMSLAFAQRQNQMQRMKDNQHTHPDSYFSILAPPAYCEMDRLATTLQCSDTFLEWCTQGATDQRDTILFPYLSLSEIRSHLQPVNRSNDARHCEVLPGQMPSICQPFRYNETPSLPLSSSVAQTRTL